MNLLKISSASLIVFCSLFWGNYVAVAEEVVSVETPIIIADVNVYDTKITSQEGNQINISFNLTNGKGVQSGVKYGVSLIKETDGGQFLADEYIYPEVLSLSTDSTVKKDISYMAPSNLSGDYNVLLTVKNSNGMPLGLSLVGQVKLTSMVKSIEITPDTCFLSVVDEKSNAKYTLVQGVDIEKTENLKLTCTILNSSKEAASVSPSYETYYRTVYGEIVLQEGGDVNPISIKPGEKKVISLILPKATKPQAYDVKVSLKSAGISSNSVVAHYVLRGVSATIQNFSLDKDYYKKDEIANISFVWSPSADSFSESRFAASALPEITLSATINNDKQKECITPINKVITDPADSGKIDLAVPVLENCENPQATITIKDASGNILDQKFLSFETKTDKIDKVGSFGSTKTILIIFGSLVVVGFAVYFINLKRKENETINQ